MSGSWCELFRGSTVKTYELMRQVFHNEVWCTGLMLLSDNIRVWQSKWYSRCTMIREWDTNRSTIIIRIIIICLIVPILTRQRSRIRQRSIPETTTIASVKQHVIQADVIYSTTVVLYLLMQFMQLHLALFQKSFIRFSCMHKVHYYDDN